MTEQQAIQIVERQRAMLGIRTKMLLDSAEKAIVEYKKDPEKPGPTEDRIAWIIVFTSLMEQVVVHVDDRNGEILRIKNHP